MSKPTFNTEFDFGFSVVDETDLQRAHEHNKEVIKNVQTYADSQEDKFNKLYDMIMPLLNNLKKDPEKEYILWPDRIKKIDAFIEKINTLKGE